jgi:hypothetical protein
VIHEVTASSHEFAQVRDELLGQSSPATPVAGDICLPAMFTGEENARPCRSPRSSGAFLVWEPPAARAPRSGSRAPKPGDSAHSRGANRGLQRTWPGTIRTRLGHLPDRTTSFMNDWRTRRWHNAF